MHLYRPTRFHRLSQGTFCLPPPISEGNVYFEPSKSGKIQNNFSSTSFGEIGSVLNEKSCDLRKKAPKIKRMRQKCHHMPDFQGFFLFFVYRPPGP